MILAYVEITAADVGKRSHAAAVRESLRQVAIQHLKVNIPNHFVANSDTAPGGAYGYAQRNAGYEERKQRKYGQQNPLTFTGELSREQRRTSYSVITATQYGSVLPLKSPHALKTRQWRELTAITPRELVDLARYANEVYLDDLKKRGARKASKRIGSKVG